MRFLAAVELSCCDGSFGIVRERIEDEFKLSDCSDIYGDEDLRYPPNRRRSPVFTPHSAMFFRSTAFFAVLAFISPTRGALTVSQPAPVRLITSGSAIAAGLKTQPSVVDRRNRLLTDADGNLLTDNFLILTDLGISVGVCFIEPCVR
ncbi:hypothetical protein C8R45DRAFT_928670 [Mycena sanguinolenta]|nr:hypothetical protein C8R45DRAFT_928670 [Mycena sanguinolenta]